MALVPTDNIRDVMAFPKTASTLDLMIDAPAKWIQNSWKSCISRSYKTDRRISIAWNRNLHDVV